jgi:hypothetical protein
MLDSEQVSSTGKRKDCTLYSEQVSLDSEQKSLYGKQKRQNSEQAAVMFN